MRKHILPVLLAVLVMAGFVGTAHAAGIVRVTGDTYDGTTGWALNGDPNNATPYEFTFDAHSLGHGSLYVKPIGATAAHKFIAANVLRTPVADVTSIAYDFQIAGNGTAADADEFYLNVYANIDDSTNFYDCRYDYVPTTGSTTAFTTATFAATDTPTSVTHRGIRIGACPATLAEMPSGSHIRAFTLNVGDTSANDEGLAGYLDNVVVTGTDTTTWDFEVPLEVKDACKDGGHVRYGFETQGACVSSLQADPNADK